MYGNGFTGANQDSYFYAGGNIAGTATFGFVTGAAFARANAAIGGFTGYGALAAQTGLFGYGAITMGYHAIDTYDNWGSLSGSQRLTAVGSPIAGMVGGYVGYNAVPAEALTHWSTVGSAARGHVNQFASSAWAELSSYRITVTPYNPNVLYSNPLPFRVSKNPSSRPPNLSPANSGRSGAFKQAKRESGIPTSQQPSRVLPNLDRRGNVQTGRVYEYDVPASGGGIKTIRIRDDAGGPNFGPNNAQNRGAHFNDESGGHYDY